MGLVIPSCTRGEVDSGLPGPPSKSERNGPCACPYWSLPSWREAAWVSGVVARPRLEPKMPDPSPPRSREPVCPEAIVCHTMSQASPGEAVVRVVFGRAQRTLLSSPFRYTADPQLVAAEPSVSFRG